MKTRHKLQALKGQYRVIGVDTFEAIDADYIIGDFHKKKEAIIAAKAHAGQMNPVYIYDDKGKEISGGFGSF